MMAKRSQGRLTPAVPGELEPLLKEWAWFLAMGVSLVVLGLVAIGYAAFVTEVAVIVIGILLLIGGLVQTVGAFWSPKWNGVFLHLVMGILYLVFGAIIVEHWVEAAEALTLLMGAFFIFAGVIGIVWSLQVRFYQWGWALLNGIVTLVLGVFILHEWPFSSFVLIGLFIGIEMIFVGCMWMMFALSLRRISQEQ